LTDLQNGVTTSTFVKKVPYELDILNDYRQKFALKRNYATPLPLRDGGHFFQEEFYNKVRVKEVTKGENGEELVPTLQEKREII
jgi:hypothetical protein